MEVIIRKARSDDLDQVIELSCAMACCNISPLRKVSLETVKNFRRSDLGCIKENYLFSPYISVFVAETPAKELIAHLIIIAGLTDQYSLERQSSIFDLCVKEKYQQKGIATLLLKKAVNFSKMNGCHYIVTGVDVSNEKAVSFLSRNGFQEEKIQLFKTINERQKKETIKNALSNIPDIKIKQLTSFSPQQLKGIIEIYLEEFLPNSNCPLRQVNLEQLKQAQKSLFRQRLINALKNKLQILTAEDKDGCVAGFSYYNKHYVSDLTTEKEGYFLDIGVKKAYKGKGLAYLLHWHTEEDIWSVKENYYIINNIYTTNKRSLTFSKKLGFQEERKTMVKKL